MNARLEMIKLLGKNIGSMIFDFGLSNIFLDMSPQARETKEKKNGTTSNSKAYTDCQECLSPPLSVEMKHQ